MPWTRPLSRSPAAGVFDVFVFRRGAAGTGHQARRRQGRTQRHSPARPSPPGGPLTRTRTLVAAIPGPHQGLTALPGDRRF